MLKRLKKYWLFCLLAPLFMMGEVSMDLWQPSLMAKIVDEGVLQSDFSLIVHVGVQMVLCVLAGGLFGVICGVFANIASQGFGNDLRKDLFGHIMSLSFEQTEKFSTGSLITRLSNDVTQVQNMVGLSIRGLVRNGVMFVGGIIMLRRQAPRFSLIAVCALPFILALVVFFLRKASPLFRSVQEKLDGVNHVMQEDVAGARVVKAYVKEAYELDRFDRANDALCRENLRVQTLLAFLGPGMNIIMNLCVVAVILAGGITVKNGGALTPGSIMAAITYLTQILGGVGFMANIFQTFTRAKASADRINEVLSCQPSLADGANEERETARGTVEFRDVSFAYPGTTQNVLEHIDLTVRQGETLAIIGATGSGKSTLIDLIPRFYDATSGEVLIDGRNVRDYPLAALREKISVVMQQTELYSRSIEENIRWGAPDADPYRIKAAAQTAQTDGFICETEYGYYTPVSEGGHSLSGGQKQRISVARAILKPHEILIFDDATSALDLRTEASLYKALNDQAPDSTKIIIAQRIASVRNADRIIVLDGGRIAACGTHASLMENSDIYRDIYLSQQREGGAA